MNNKIKSIVCGAICVIGLALGFSFLYADVFINSIAALNTTILSIVLAPIFGVFAFKYFLAFKKETPTIESEDELTENSEN